MLVESRPKLTSRDIRILIGYPVWQQTEDMTRELHDHYGSRIRSLISKGIIPGFKESSVHSPTGYKWLVGWQYREKFVEAGRRFAEYKEGTGEWMSGFQLERVLIDLFSKPAETCATCVE